MFATQRHSKLLTKLKALPRLNLDLIDLSFQRLLIKTVDEIV